jgi:hypothetical protein
MIRKPKSSDLYTPSTYPLISSSKMPQTEDQDTTIPVIDLSNPTEETAEQVLHAASTHGFLFIKNDGVTIPPADIDDMFNLASPPSSTSPHQLTDQVA